MRKRDSTKKLVQFAYQLMQAGVYKQWLREFLITLSSKEVKQLKRDMPAYVITDG